MLRGMQPACVSRRQGPGAGEPSTNRNRRVTSRGETKGVQGTGFGHRGAHWGGQQGGAAEAAGTARAVGTRCARAQPPHAPGAQISRRAFKYASPRHSQITLNKFTHTHRRSRGRHRRSSNQTTSSFFACTSAKTASQTRRPKQKWRATPSSSSSWRSSASPSWPPLVRKFGDPARERCGLWLGRARACVLRRAFSSGLLLVQPRARARTARDAHFAAGCPTGPSSQCNLPQRQSNSAAALNANAIARPP